MTQTPGIHPYLLRFWGQAQAAVAQKHAMTENDDGAVAVWFQTPEERENGVGSEPYRWPEHIRLWWEAHQLEDVRRKAAEAKAVEAHKAHLRKLRAEIDAELGE